MKDMKHILIVDDDKAIQDAVAIMLAHKGYRITTLSDGASLLSGLSDCPDLIILDKQLPGVDGLDICRYLKGQAGSKNIPVLILSASPETEHMAKAARADGFLEKPFKMQLLRETVERLIGGWGAGRGRKQYNVCLADPVSVGHRSTTVCHADSVSRWR